MSKLPVHNLKKWAKEAIVCISIELFAWIVLPLLFVVCFVFLDKFHITNVNAQIGIVVGFLAAICVVLFVLNHRNSARPRQ